MTVALLDAGDETPSQTGDDASRAHILDPRRHVPMDLAVRRAFGGTSWLWGGRCVPYDDIDFERRDFVPHSGWPLSHDDIRPWYGKGAAYLGCGKENFEASPPGWSDPIEDVTVERLEAFSLQPNRATPYRDVMRHNSRIDLRLKAPVTEITLDAGLTQVENLAIGGDASSILRARYYVIACGGLETTRLLLATQLLRPPAFGGPDGALGRYYQAHVEGSIANIIFNTQGEIEAFDFKTDACGVYSRHRIALVDEVLRRNRISNISFTPDNLPYHDPQHGTGIKSLIFLLMCFPPLGRKLICVPMRRIIIGDAPGQYGAHLLNILRSPLEVLKEIVTIAHARYVKTEWKPGWLVRSADRKYLLRYRAEHRPNRDSCVRLTEERDGLGMARLDIDLRYEAEDASSVVRAHAILDRALRQSGKGRLEYVFPEAELEARVMEQAFGGYHQIGLTRMGLDPGTSVVGPNCQVHGVANLFVASSSVFPTSGQANPTLLATTLAVRLAHYLARVAQRSLQSGAV